MSAQSEVPRFPFPPSPVPYDPGPEIREMMAKCPVSKVRLPDDSTAWLVTGFGEATDVMQDSFIFTSLASLAIFSVRWRAGRWKSVKGV